jgi:hypothetical protein
LSLKNRDIFLGSDFFNGELRPKLQGLSAVLRAKHWAIKVLELGGGSHIN